MSASSRRRFTAIRNIRTAPPPRAHIGLRLVALIAFLSVAAVGGATAAGFAYYNSVHVHLNACSFICSENSEILASNHKLLYERVGRSVNSGSKVLKPLELNPKNHRQCPEGRKTHLRRFNYRFGSGYVPYLTCNGWGIPKSVANATIATEDPTFYSNPGFDPLSIARAAFQDLTSGQIQSGASTIAQQLAKLYILHDNSPTISRKLKEIVVAYRLTQKYPKRFILYLYLNSVYYGHLAYGVEAAAETFFHVDVSHVKLWQAAMIAGMPQSPSYYDPFLAQSISKHGVYPPWYSRMLEVLNFLQERGYISKNKERMAERKAQRYNFRLAVTPMKQANFVNYVIDQFQQMSNPNNPATADPYLIGKLDGRGLNSGLKIITTLRPKLQLQAEQDVKNQVLALDNPYDGASDGALVSINVRRGCYGCIMAMVGSAGVDPKTIDLNMADSPRQPGSSIKVFNYVSAFKKGLSPGSYVWDSPISIPLGTIPQTYYSPLNYEQTFLDRAVTLRYALDNSLNVPAVRVEVWNGPRTVARTAYKFGITDFWRDNPGCCGYATTLGGIGGGVRLVQETSAYGVFATGGMRVPPISFTKIVDRATGKVLWRLNKDTWLRQKSYRVIKAQYAYMISSILSDNVTRAPDFGEFSPLNLSPYTAAAKTGTTSSFKDNWTVGYTPQIVTGVWVGNADDAAMGLGVNGITGAAPIWHTFMLQAFSTLHLQNLPFNQPAGMEAETECNNQPYTSSTPVLSTFPGDISGYPIGRIPLCQVPASPGIDVPVVTAEPTSVPSVPQPTPVPTTPPSTSPGLLP